MKSDGLYIGIMSGTSLDAVDAALIDCRNGTQLIATASTPLPLQIQQEIRALNSCQHNELARSLILSKEIAYIFSDTVNALLKQENIKSSDIIAIGSHGQTIRHAPTGKLGYSLQIGCPSTIAENTNITVVADFRNRDVAAGGQGAPLVPAFHQAVFASENENRAIINIGGMANASVFIKNQAVLGFDTGPGNVLMNAWIMEKHGKQYDKDGEWAASGKVVHALLEKMLEEPFFALPPPKSTGRERFDLHWLHTFTENIEPSDVQATLLELTATSICQSLPAAVEAIYLCGGGAYNTRLVSRIAEISQLPTASTGQLGIAPEWVEASAFAWLAKQTMNHAAGNLPTATGAKGDRILGGVYWSR